LIRTGTIALSLAASLAADAAAPAWAQRSSDNAPGIGSGALAKLMPVPRTPWGDPDLQGVWTSDEEAGVPFERPATVAGKDVLEGAELEELLEQREQRRAQTAPVVGGITGAGPTHWYENWGRRSPRTSLVIEPKEGRVPPLTPEAEKRQRTRVAGGSSFGNGPFDKAEDFSLYDRCITRGLPGVMFPGVYNNNSRIVQAPGYVAITYEMIHETRVIPIDGRPFPSDQIRQYMGDARGHWEGHTLVVETRNFSARTNFRGSGATLRLVERFRRVGKKGLRYEVTIDDPKTFMREWTAALNLKPQAEVFEYACHEGNYAMRNMLSAARAAETGVATGGRPHPPVR
jgi:hypothetical protein